MVWRDEKRVNDITTSIEQAVATSGKRSLAYSRYVDNDGPSGDGVGGLLYVSGVSPEEARQKLLAALKSRGIQPARSFEPSVGRITQFHHAPTGRPAARASSPRQTVKPAVRTEKRVSAQAVKQSEEQETAGLMSQLRALRH